jgi:hypothetical protein
MFICLFIHFSDHPGLGGRASGTPLSPDYVPALIIDDMCPDKTKYVWNPSPQALDTAGTRPRAESPKPVPALEGQEA